MRQAIQTKYFGPTNSRGARIKATCSGGSITVSWKYELSTDENHLEAATSLLVKMGWHESLGLRGGTLPDESYAFTLIPRWTSAAVGV